MCLLAMGSFDRILPGSYVLINHTQGSQLGYVGSSTLGDTHSDTTDHVSLNLVGLQSYLIIEAGT